MNVPALRGIKRATAAPVWSTEAKPLACERFEVLYRR